MPRRSVLPAIVLPALTLLAAGVPRDAGATSLRFHGFGAGDVDRVKIAVDDPFDPDDEPGPPVDAGAGDFTLEFHVRGTLAENPAPAVSCGANENWILGNIVFDRDRWEPGGRDWGVSLGAGRVVFGVTNGSLQSATFCGATGVLDGAWHHVAVQRRAADGLVQIWVDGALDAAGAGPPGDVSYPGDETPSGTNCGGAPCLGSDPFLVIGAEKHDAGPSFPSFSGWIDEVRISGILRYTVPFAPPSAPFTPDAATLALYHFDEGEGDTIGDASSAPGGPSPGVRRFGGAPLPGPEWSAETPFAATAVAPPPFPAAGEAQVEAHPNPALDQTLLWVRYGDGRAGDVAVEIVDVAGRRAVTLRGMLRAGAAMLVWDGRADDGAPVRPGVYFARAPGAGEAAKIVRP